MHKNIFNYTETELAKELALLGEPAYRAKQIFKGLYSSRWKKFSDFTTLSKNFRNQLDNEFKINHLILIESIKSELDETTKFLWKLPDGKKIESVIIYEGKRVTFCISSQVGCALDCKFCATGKMGIIRNLLPGEIIEQVLQMEERSKYPPTNIVFMGMGEPMLNYDAVMQAANVLSDPEGLCFSRKRITISTSGIIKNIYRMADENRPFSLAISLNSVNQDIRKALMPVSRKYPIEKLLAAAKYYTEKTGKRITFEYVLIKDLNDSDKDAEKLVEITKGIPCKINVIPCNSSDPDYQPPSWDRVERFDRYVNASNRTITIRNRKGWEIKAACGQLYTANENMNK
ncbi:MAG: 23S rRNA (adenine(2503)-C(2))-methyltransferase RlmN [Calditrichaceae bacterium]